MHSRSDLSTRRSDGPPRPRSGRSARALGGAAAALVLAGSLAACGHTAPAPTGPSSSPSVSAAPAKPLGPTRVRIVQSHQHLPKSVRVVLGRRVGKVIDGWWDKAYLGTYPRTKASFAGAFAGFTPTARRLAAAKPATMTNEGLAAATQVAVVRRWITLDVLGVKKAPVGVAADCHLVFSATTAKGTKQYQVHARVELTKTKGVWRIFAFAVQKGTVAPGSASKQTTPKKRTAHSKGAGR
jgi:hypothetical protein